MHEQPRAVADTLLDRLLPDGTLSPGRGPHLRRRVPGRQQGLHRGLRQQLPRRPDGQVRHRALGPHPRRDRHRQRVPLPRSGAGLRHPGDRGQPVRARRSTPSRPWRRPSRQGAKVLVISNVVDSSMAREADAVLYTRAGPEIGVAATKTHLAQITALEILALYLAQVRGTLPPGDARALFDAMGVLPDKVAAGPGAGRRRCTRWPPGTATRPRSSSSDARSATRWPSRGRSS